MAQARPGAGSLLSRARGRHRRPSATRRRIAVSVSAAVPMATAGMTLAAAPAQADTLSPREIAGYAQQYGLPCTQAVAIVLGESSGETDAHNPSGEDSVGIWQINLDAHADKMSRSSARDPGTATRYAKQLYRESGWTPWGAYTNGSYAQFLDEARASCGNPVQHTTATASSGGSGSGNSDGGGGRTYQIEHGDTLSGIAARFDTTVAKLTKVNDIANPDLIYAGDAVEIR